MSKKSYFRRPFDKKLCKRSQTLFKPARQYLYHIYWSLWRTFSSRNFFLVICKILGLFLNTLTSDDKSFLLNRYNLTQPIQKQLFKKQKLLSIFSTFWKSGSSFKPFEKQITLIAYVFSKLRTAKKTWRDICLKSLVSEVPSTGNMVNGPKTRWNLHDSTLIIFIDHSDENWVGENLF